MDVTNPAACVVAGVPVQQMEDLRESQQEQIYNSNYK